ENSVPEANEDNNRRTLEIPVRPGRLVVRPNPFTPNGDNRNDRAEFDLTQLSLSRPLLKIYDLNGRSIRVLSDISANRLSWDGSDGFGRQALPGVYLYVLQDGNENVAQGQVVLAR
ncbi:MAG: gliding motility-associated C-terminal domain-containing protein, partial [Calditrichaeota bacterium]|nr:gliding motility-associated C-terminal domain-containing protein [Calditrichota bacterium]